MLALVVTAQEDIDQIARELRAALQEHILRAKESLKDQFSVMAVLEHVSRQVAAPSSKETLLGSPLDSKLSDSQPTKGAPPPGAL